MKIKIDLIHKLSNFTQRLSDIRFTGQLVFVVLVLLISWSGVKSIQTNYGLQKQIASIKQQNNIQSLQNTNLVLQNQYYNSNQYLELAARENFGLAVPGEKEIVVPESVAMSYTINLSYSSEVSKINVTVPSYQRNIQSWVDFFLHRPDTSN